MKAKKLLFALAIGIVAIGCNSGGSYEKTSAPMKTKADTASYYLGYLNGTGLARLRMSDLNMEALLAGMNAAVQKKDVGVNPQAMEMYLTDYMQVLTNQIAQKNLEKGKKFLEENAKKPGVDTLSDGIQYKVITKGEGKKPLATDVVKVHYKGTLLDGTEFDSSISRGEPAEFPLNHVIPGWTKSLQAMPVGSKWIIYIPSDQAYGPRGGGPIGPNETLIFEVELLEIVTPEETKK